MALTWRRFAIIVGLAVVFVALTLYRGSNLRELDIFDALKFKFTTPNQKPGPNGEQSQNNTGSEGKKEPPPKIPAVVPDPFFLNGSWSYEMRSDSGRKPYEGFLVLKANAEGVWGTFKPEPEDNPAGDYSSVNGSFVGNQLTLQRQTNQSGVLQVFRLERHGEMFEGRFENIGSNVPASAKDSGTFTLLR